MSTGAEGSRTSRFFELRCVDCQFTRTVEGSVFEVLDLADSHQAEYGADATDHFVEFESAEASEDPSVRP